MLNVLENKLTAGNRKFSSFRWKKNVFQANALKVGATSNIIHELRKKFQKSKGFKIL